MDTTITALGGPIFVIGLIALGLSGNERMRLRPLLFLIGAVFAISGASAELIAAVDNHTSASHDVTTDD